MCDAEKRLKVFGLSLPEPWKPRSMFLPWRKAGSLVYLSGQICEWEGQIVLEGPVGVKGSLEQAREAARICALNLLHCFKQACNTLDNVAEIVRVGGFVNCVPQFPDAPKVIDGASDLFIALYGDAGRHVRTAVGVNGLPGNVAVEVDAIVRLIE